MKNSSRIKSLILGFAALSVAQATKAGEMELKIQGISIGRTQKKTAQTKISLSHDFGARYIDLRPIMDKGHEARRAEEQQI